MKEQSDRERLRRTCQGQLECDLLLGGWWLPIGKLKAVEVVRSMAQVASGSGGGAVEGAPGKAARVEARSEGPPKPRSFDSPEVVAKARRLEQVAEKVRECRKCPLYEARTNGVPGEGHPDARIVFVGEAPGADEDAQGRPFVGRAGKLLTNIIEGMGLKRSEVFIGNILKSRPPDNRDPSALEIAACIDHLYEQLDIIEPEIIVALGAYASRTLLDSKDSIGRLRGKVHEYYPHPMARPIKLVATYHPAYLLRNYSTDSRRRVWDDMKMVLRELNLPVPGKKK
jgi:uracil-DNA glycosylase family 4